jgi:hypothetical protein
MNILTKWLLAIKSRTAAHERAVQDLERVRGLPFDDVKRHALDLISDRRRFRSVVGARSPNPAIETLGPILRDFFERFESVEEINGDFAVSRQAVRPSTLRPGFVSIGSDFAHAELVTQPGDDRVFIVTDSDHALDGLPTIYHNIYLLDS